MYTAKVIIFFLNFCQVHTKVLLIYIGKFQMSSTIIFGFIYDIYIYIKNQFYEKLAYSEFHNFYSTFS